MGHAHVHEVAALFDMGEFRRPATDVHENALLHLLADGSSHETQMSLLFAGDEVYGEPRGLFDGMEGLSAVGTVAQHGGGEDAHLLAIYVLGALEVIFEDIYGPLDACIREGSLHHIGGEAGHRFLIQDLPDLAGLQLLPYVLLNVEHYQSDGVRSQVYDAYALQIYLLFRVRIPPELKGEAGSFQLCASCDSLRTDVLALKPQEC